MISEAVTKIQGQAKICYLISAALGVCLDSFLLLAMLIPFSYSSANYPYVYNQIFYVVLYGSFALLVFALGGISLYVAINIKKRSKFIYYAVRTVLMPLIILNKFPQQEVKAYYF